MQNFSVSKSNFINSNNFTTYYVDVAMEIITGGNITHQRRDTNQDSEAHKQGLHQ
jgi:predicted RNA-binding protein associated with RNAse of E/G family